MSGYSKDNWINSFLHLYELPGASTFTIGKNKVAGNWIDG